MVLKRYHPLAKQDGLLTRRIVGHVKITVWKKRWKIEHVVSWLSSFWAPKGDIMAKALPKDTMRLFTRFAVSDMVWSTHLALR